MSAARTLTIWSAGLAVVGAVSSWLAHRECPLFYADSKLTLDPVPREVVSIGAGFVFAVLVIAFTRVSVRRWTWAKQLHNSLRPIAQQLSTKDILVLALLSGVGEELLFRSLLVPWIGPYAQALVFGVLHQTRGPSRWVWASWAAIVGLVFGLMYEYFGTLSGPVVAHCLINGVNLTLLRSSKPKPCPS